MKRAIDEREQRVSMECVYPDGGTSEATYRADYTFALYLYDTFQSQVYWPLRNVIPYLGRMDA